MATNNILVLVLGATGNQGGAVVDALLEDDVGVRAMVRDTQSAKAQALAARGVQLVVGDFEHADSVAAAAQGVDAVFVNTSPFAPEVGIDGEIRQGRAIIEGLVSADVPHVVYSSVSDADRKTGVPHFDSKMDAEQRLADSDLKYTITCPVFFADNVAMPWSLPGLKAGTFRQAMPGSRALQVVSLREIGRFNAAVIARGPSLHGRRINYAGDELTPLAMATALGDSAGRPIAYEEQPLAEVEAYSADMASMFGWLDRVGYTADIAKLREEFPEVGWTSFTEWAKAQPWQELLA